MEIITPPPPLPQILNSNMQIWSSETKWGETQTRLDATSEAGVGGKLIRIKNFSFSMWLLLILPWAGRAMLCETIHRT